MKKVSLLIVVCCVTLFSYARDYKWALMGVNGQSFHNGMAIKSEKDKETGKYRYGAVNRSGEVVIPFKFNMIKEVYGGFTGGYCVASVDEGEGIIDMKGNFVFGPTKDIEFYREEKYPMVFRLKDKKTGKNTIFYNGVVLTDYKWDSVNGWRFPFLKLDKYKTDDSEAESICINATTGDWLEGYYDWKTPEFYVVSKGDNYLYYDKKGNRINPSTLTRSSRGVEVFKDNATDRYGLRKDGAVIVEPKYKLSSNGAAWVKDLMVLTDSISAEVNSTDLVFNAMGENIYRNDERNVKIAIYNSCMCYYTSDHSAQGMMSLDGKEIEPLRGLSSYEICDGWIMSKDGQKNRLYSINKNKFYDSLFSLAGGDGEIIKHNNGGKYFVINPKTGAFYGPYDDAGEYSEGLIPVTKSGKRMFVSADGTEYELPAGWDFNSDGFSEGVCRVTDANSVHGYIYNPLGTTYVYNQKSMDNNKYLEGNLIESADEAFRKGDYGTAQEYLFRLMMLKPTNARAVNNYASCLLQLGHLEEALSFNQKALEIDPSYQYAIDNQKIILDAIEERDNPKTNAENTVSQEVSSGGSFWNALASFGAALSNVMGQISGGYTGGSYSGGSYPSGGGTSGTSGASGGNYVSQYRNWERIAERHYNSLTNTGLSVKNSNGSRSGKAGNMSPSVYNNMKRSYREAQREMRSIREKAARNGVNIPPSQWETNPISY